MNASAVTEARWSWLARVLVPPIVAGLALAGLQLAALFDEPPRFTGLATTVYVLVIYAMAEGIRAISRGFDRVMPWRERRGARAIAQWLAGVVFAGVFLFVVWLPTKHYEIAHGANDVIGWPHIVFTSLIGVIFGAALSTLQLLIDLAAQWRQAQVDAERARLAAMRAELDALKAQINPHFLFNGFNVIHGLIAEDPSRAREVLLELSEVFRYVLSHGQRDCVPLAAEIAFVEAYARVLQARHGDALRVTFDALGDTRSRGLPPMTLQLLVENAVRHNQLDGEEGLHVRVTRQGDTLRVSNTLRPRRGDTRGTGMGLAHVEARYRLLGAEGMRVTRDDAGFHVELPLLPCSP